MENENKYCLFVTRIILSNKEHKITEVKNLESIGRCFFKQEEYPSILEMIKAQDWKKIDSLGFHDQPKFREYLEIYRFQDWDGNIFVATIYDSDALDQDPEIIQLIPLTK